MVKKENLHMKVYEVEKIFNEYKGQNGEVVEITKKGPVIKCNKGAIKLLKIKLDGKKIQTGSDLVNGRKVSLGDVFNG